jgi:drug/metabolite transporter (DMT)-like permease
VPVLLALLSSLLWGTADFLGGTLTRRRSPYTVVGWSQVAGLVVILVAALIVGDWSPWTQVVLVGIAAGATGYVGLLSFYTALARGTMGVVAPVTALGAIVPVVFGLIEGDQPSGVQGIGVVVALVGVVLASGPELTGAKGSGAGALLLAVVAAACFGSALTLIAVGSRTDALATLGVMRVTTVAMSVLLVLVVLVRSRSAARAAVRVSRAEVVPLGAVGVFDVTANITYGIASTLGLLSIVSVAGSLYPVATVLLARFVHHERLMRVQQIGVALALVGVGLIASG